MLLAVAASALVSSLAIAAGALAAFGGHVLGSAVPAAGGAVLVALAFAERTTRVRGTNARLVHVGASLLTGALAGSLATAYASASPAVRGVAVLVSAVLVSLPLLVEADDPLARDARGHVEARQRSRARVAPRRRRAAPPGPRRPPRRRDRARRARARGARSASSPSRASASSARKARVEDASLARGRASSTMLDQRIADHVTALARAYTAVDTAHAAAVGLVTTPRSRTSKTSASTSRKSRARSST